MYATTASSCLEEEEEEEEEEERVLTRAAENNLSTTRPKWIRRHLVLDPPSKGYSESIHKVCTRGNAIAVEGLCSGRVDRYCYCGCYC